MMKLGSGMERDGTEACRTAVMRGEAELRIFNFKTPWSEFQKPSQTAAEQG